MIELLFSSLFLIAIVFFVSLAIVEGQVWRYRRRNKTALPTPLLVTLTTGPVLLATAILLALSLTFLGKGTGLIVDHCLVHGLNHPHLCFEHLPAGQLSFLAVVGASLLILYIAVKLATLVKSTLKYARVNRSVSQLQTGRINWLDSDREMAFVAGIRQPRIYLTHILKKRLSRQALRIIVAHEIQHIRNRDLLKMFLIECLLSLYSRRTKTYLMNQWVLYREQKVDRQLAGRFGRAAVADALLRMLPIKNHEAGLNSAGGDIEQRITALANLNERDLFSAKRAYQWVAVLTLSITIFLTAEHHALETLIGWIT